MDFNGTKYAYIVNLQSDIVGIFNSSGAEVVRYTYDAWGKLLETTGTMAATLGFYNLFRYRGYVYDEETGRYYLRSRYYNLEWNRFLNADHVNNIINAVKFTNLFPYCANHCVINIDGTGKAYTQISRKEPLITTGY